MLVNPTHSQRDPSSLKVATHGDFQAKKSSVERSATHPVDTLELAEPVLGTPTPSDFEHPAFAEPVILASDDVAPADLAKLRATANEATAYFQTHFGEVKRPLRFEVGKASQALRTGYNFQTDTIGLPNLDSVKNRGLESIDVIRHEIFHALIFGSYPELCQPETMKDPSSLRLHESLADYFAYQMQPDNGFGEDFSLNDSHLRDYRNGLSISLTAGAHAQGNALTSHLLNNHVSKEQVKQFLSQGDFSLSALGAVNSELDQDLRHDASLTVEIASSPPYPNSTLNRYRLKKDVPLELAFQPGPQVLRSHPDFQVVWTDVKGMPSRQFLFEETAPGQFSVTASPEADIEKLIARYYDKDTLIGFHPFYFGTHL